MIFYTIRCPEGATTEALANGILPWVNASGLIVSLQARLLAISGGTPVKYTVTKSGVVLNIGDIPADEIDHIVELTLKK